MTTNNIFSTNYAHDVSDGTLTSTACNINTSFESDVKINGLGIAERLTIIETMLGLPVRDVELENKHPHLKNLYQAHIAAMAHDGKKNTAYTEEMKKLRTFEILKKDNV